MTAFGGGGDPDPVMRRADRGGQAADCRRLVYRSAWRYHYMKISLIFDAEGRRVEAAFFKQLIVSALRDLYGEVGAAFPFDVLKFDGSSLTAILRVYSSGLVKLWSALTLLGSYQKETCAVRVTQVSPFLLALAGNSRELELN